MRRFFWIRLRILLRQTRWGFALLALWFAFGILGYYRWAGLSLGRAVLNALYLGRERGWFWDLYSFWGQCLVFGIIVSIFLMQAVERYNPQEGCRMLAMEMKDHAIVIGYTHLGARIIEHFQRNHLPYVLIEKDATAVDDLVRAGEPVIVDNAKEAGTLEEAGIERAKLVLVASNNIETALLVTKRARDRNRRARIIVRCYLDEFTEILEGLGADDVISSSKSAFLEVCRRLEPRSQESEARSQESEVGSQN